MSNPKKKEFTTYASIDDIRTVCPKIGDYIKPYISDPEEAKSYIKRCLKLANVWIHNQIEQSEMNTFARSNEKELVEANYATFLILRGTLRGERSEQNQWMFSYKEDAISLLEQIVNKATQRPGLSSRTKKVHRNRTLIPNNLEDSYPLGYNLNNLGDI